MRKMSRQFLSVLLAAVMILSHVQISAAAGNDTASGSPAAASGNEAEGTQNLEMEPMDPAKLGIKKLGEETEEAGDEGDGEISLTPDTSLNKTVRVSIFLDGKSTVDAGFDTKGIASNQSAVSYRNALKAQQAKMTARIESVLGHSLDVKWNLTLLVNAISVNVKVKEIPLIERLEGVKKVVREMYYLAPVTEPGDDPQTANTSENMVGAMNAWNQLGYTGAGSRIAIIDTGLDTAHQSVNNDAFNHAIEEVRASGKTVNLMTSIPSSGLNANNPKRVSAKIPYAYNYIDNNNTNVGHNDNAGNHGSHVAGIAAANRYIKSGSTFVDAADTVGAVGMAPDAQLLIMKVFGQGGGAYDSDYFAALEDAIVLGADAANLSLGSAAPGWTYDTEYQDKLNSFVNNSNNHMVVSISAGNSFAADDFTSHNLYAEDASFHTGGSPGSYINSLGVASAENTLTKGTPLVFNGSQQVFYTESTEDSDGNAYSNPKMTSIAGTYDYVYIDALGTASDYSTVNSALSLSGKIVIIDRGDISFSEKGNNAKTYNPKAVIVANNTDGTINMNLADFTGTFPMVSILLKDAQQIKVNSAAHTAGSITYYTGRVQVTTTEVTTIAAREDAEMSDFSSWGVPGSLIMKPEITAPGGDIYSINGTSSASSDSNTGTTSYVSYSGTSMAAPHIAGLSAVLMQYLKEKTPANAELTSGYNLRAIAQSLLMSTATPMINSNAYVSILQQGSGLVEVSDAIEAKSVIMMNEAGLTTSTGAAADGKVKVELGDDPARNGEHDFSFTIYNISDKTLTFELDTDLFTQAVTGEGYEATLSHKTTLLPAGGVSYVWNGSSAADTIHDVNQDGTTDSADAQAILDLVTGKCDETGLNLDAADMDGDDDITTYDAYLLLNWEPEAPAEGYTIPAQGKAEVTVRIRLTAAQKAVLNTAERRGGYLEGFTYVTCTTADSEGVSYAHEHSIPILGYFGSWTDPSMFDTNSYTESLYGNDQENYSGNSAESTNYVRITTNGTLAKFSGNPYMVEEEFPEEHLAIRSDAKINNIAYNMIRSAAGTGFAISKIDGNGNVTRILDSAFTGSEVYGSWFHVNNQAWQNTTTKVQNVNKALNEFNGLAEGDRVRVGFYAIPEYNTMLKSSDLTASAAGLLTADMFRSILTDNVLGKGAFMGFDLTIDDTDPEVVSASVNGNTLSITASDNRALAYVAVLSLDGSVKYAEVAPGSDTYTVSFDASDAIANAAGYVAAFAGDYAGNEAAVAIKVNDKMHEERTVYVLTSAISAGHDYLIVSRNTAGSGAALGHTQATAAVNNVTVKAANTSLNQVLNAPYIESRDVAETSVWTTASSGSNWTFENDSYYLGVSRSGSLFTYTYSLTFTTSNSNNVWKWKSNSLQDNSYSRYLEYSGNAFSLNSSSKKIYLYEKRTYTTDVDPYSVSSVTVSPNSVELYRGDTVNLTAKIAPLTANPRTVTWTSSNTNVATVNEVGIVTAISAGNATIRATSNADNTKYGECTVTVVSINKSLNGIIWDEEGSVFFSSFNANNLPNWNKLSGAVTVDDNPLYLHNAYMADTSTLYASTQDLSSTSSIIYTVNRNNYVVTEFGTNYVPAFGMTRASTRYTDYFVYGFAKYLIFGNLTPVEDEEGTFSGIPYGLLDLTTTSVGDAYAVAVCAKSISTTSSSFYFLDETGKIWQTTMSIGSSVSFGTPTLVYDTGINAGLQYNSIYYDGTNLYWTHQDGNVALLYILANANTAASRKFYRAGNFGEGVWPAAGLYVNGSLAPASVGGDSEIMEAGDETFDASTLKIQATRDELFTADIQARFAAEAERMAAKKVNAPAEVPAEPAPVEEVTETESVETPAETESPEAPAEETEAPAETEAEPEETETEPAETEAPAEESETDPEETEAAEEVTEAPVEETEEPSDEDPEEEPEEATDAEAEESSEEESLDPAYTGSLNVAHIVSAPKKQVTDVPVQKAETPNMTEDGIYTVTINEAAVAENGLYAIIYNPDEMGYISMQPLNNNLFFCSNYVDEEKGVISFAFASKNGVAANEDIVTFTFALKRCEEGMTLEVETLERNTVIDLEEVDEVDIDVENVNMPKFQTHNLILSGEIGVSFFMNLDMLTAEERTTGYVEFLVKSNSETTVAAFDSGFMNSAGTLYGFTCYINVLQMADEIHAVFHYQKDGIDRSVDDYYSAEMYIQKFEENASNFPQATQNLVRTIADYGYYSQIYLAEVNNLTLGGKYAKMTKHYTESYNYTAIKASVQDYALTYNIEGTGVTKVTHRLSLESETILDIFFVVKEGVELTATAVFNGKTYAAVLQDDGRYRIRINEIAAHRLGGADYNVNITGNANGAFTASAWALSYVNATLDSNLGDNAKNAMCSLYRYYEAAAAYKAASAH